VLNIAFSALLMLAAIIIMITSSKKGNINSPMIAFGCILIALIPFTWVIYCFVFGHADTIAIGKNNNCRKFNKLLCIICSGVFGAIALAVAFIVCIDNSGKFDIKEFGYLTILNSMLVIIIL
jgi:hypothetical protein